MGTVNHAYDPNQSIYVIDSCDGNPFISGGVVIRVRINVLVSETTIKYDIRLDGTSGTKEYNESDVFVDKASALTAYDAKI